VAAVTEDFTHDGYWDQADAEQGYSQYYSPGGTKNYTGEVLQMQQNIQNLTRLDSKTCNSIYSKLAIGSSYRNALLVTSATQNNTWLGGYLAFPETEFNGNFDFEDWMYGVGFGGPSSCPGAIWDGVNKSLPIILSNRTRINGSFECEVYNAPLQYCLAEPANEFSLHCTVSANTNFLIIVLVCNFVKLVCLVTTMMAWKFRPLAVVGDAVASFMARPDSSTTGLGPLSWKTAQMFTSRKLPFRRKFEKLGPRGTRWNGSYDIRWRGKAYRWSNSISSLCSYGAVVL
jgi:hypothetical protein